jgi:hypothetical protein
MHVDNSSATLSRTSIQRWVWVLFAFLLAATFIAAIAFAPFPAQADIASAVGKAIAEFISWVLSAIVSVLGKLLLVAIYILTLIAQYNEFVSAPPVVNGWVIVRDVGNMFFIIVLLIIAFATILNVPNYQWKAMLPKLVIAAILINFSKTIAGLLIDLSQVITLTFVNGFAAAAGGNFAQMYKIRELVSINPGYEEGINILAIVGGYFLAFVLLAIALVTTLIMAVIFAFRIVMLWALVVLSPLPWVLNIIPQGKKYGDKWWSMFGEYLTVGPVLAFFLWLSLVSLGTGEVSGFTGTGGAGASSAELAEYEKSTSSIPSEAGKPASLIGFVISICMLIAGMKITGEMGVIGAGAMKKAQDKIGSAAKWTAKKAAYYGTGAAAARSLGTRAVQSEAAQKVLGGMAASGIPFVNDLALKAMGATTSAKKKREEEAEKRIANIKDPRVLARIAQGTAVGADAAALRAVARKRSPSALGKEGARKELENMSDDELLKIHPDEVERLMKQESLNEGQRALFMQRGSIMQRKKAGLPEGFNSLEEWRRATGADPGTFPPAPGEQVDRPERQRRLAEGRVSLKDVPDADLTAEDGAHAEDIAVHASVEDRRELTKSRTRRSAYKTGLKAALAAQRRKPPAERNVETERSLAAEYARLGASFSESFGTDIEGFAKAITGKQGGDIIAGISPTDLRREDVGGLIAEHADPAQLGQALKKAQEEGDKERAEALRFAIDGIREELTARTKPVVESRAKVKTLQQSSSGGAREVSRLDGRVAQAAAALRAAAGTPQQAEMQTRLAAAQGALDAERTRQEQITKDLEAEQKNLETLERTHEKELKKLGRLKAPKYNV